MKKLAELFTVVVFIIAFAAPLFAVSNEPVEVPAGSWEYDAIAQLAAKGFFADYPDGLGGAPITRDEVGAILESVLPVDVDQISAEDAQILELLVEEFGDELTDHGVKHIRSLGDVDKINPTWR
ncbi:MAG: S-layer homology domain-containing protein [Oscillospiraceae bacterium]|nr:S-layer homology domain-containing protein [Oscillospiraceae bacterium]